MPKSESKANAPEPIYSDQERSTLRSAYDRLVNASTWEDWEITLNDLVKNKDTLLPGGLTNAFVEIFKMATTDLAEEKRSDIVMERIAHVQVASSVFVNEALCELLKTGRYKINL